MIPKDEKLVAIAIFILFQLHGNARSCSGRASRFKWSLTGFQRLALLVSQLGSLNTKNEPPCANGLGQLGHLANQRALHRRAV